MFHTLCLWLVKSKIFMTKLLISIRKLFTALWYVKDVMCSIKDSSTSLECVTRAFKVNHRERRWIEARFQGNPSRVDFVFHFFNWKRDRTAWLPLHLWLWLHHQFGRGDDKNRPLALSIIKLFRFKSARRQAHATQFSLINYSFIYFMNHNYQSRDYRAMNLHMENLF